VGRERGFSANTQFDEGDECTKRKGKHKSRGRGGESPGKRSKEVEPAVGVEIFVSFLPRFTYDC